MYQNGDNISFVYHKAGTGMKKHYGNAPVVVVLSDNVGEDGYLVDIRNTDLLDDFIPHRRTLGLFEQPNLDELSQI